MRFRIANGPGLVKRVTVCFCPALRYLGRPEVTAMQVSNRLVPSCLLLTVFTVSIAAAQSTEQRRKPDVPYVPTTDEAVQAMLKLADVKKSDNVYDLGCGDGRIVISAARDFGTRAVGIDIDP